MKIGVINSVFVLNNSCSGKLFVIEWLWGVDESSCGCMETADWVGGERQCHFQCVLGWGRCGVVMTRGWMMTTLGWYGTLGGMGRSTNLSARLAYLISLSSQCSVVKFLWASAVLMSLQVERDKTELVSAKSRLWKRYRADAIGLPGLLWWLLLISKLFSFLQTPQILSPCFILYFSTRFFV